MRVSVVVPVYNSEEYISRTINSIINQTLGFENIELIFVDDNSTDSSCEIIKVKTINMGSMFKVYYQVTFKDIKEEKKLIDEIRCRNGNLEVSVQRVDYKKSEL